MGQNQSAPFIPFWNPNGTFLPFPTAPNDPASGTPTLTPSGTGTAPPTQNSWMYDYQQNQPSTVQQAPTQPAQPSTNSPNVTITPAKPQQVPLMPANGQLNPAYIKWKISATCSDYINMRKYFSWKDACKGNVTDWKGYADWRKNVWDNSPKNALNESFTNWKNIFDWNDCMKWKMWAEWERIKDTQCGEKRKYRCRKDDKEECKRRDEYKKFVVKAKVKVYAKFYKFRDWHNHCRTRGIEHTEFKAYYSWSKEYKYNNEKVVTAFENWRKAPIDENEFQMWLLWNKWQKLREKAATMTDLNEKPDWYNANKNYGGYRGYYGRRGSWDGSHHTEY